MTETQIAANHTVNKYSLIAGAVGIVPIPIVDLAGITATQLAMLNGLAKQYGVPFTKELGKSAIASLVGGLASTRLAYGTAGSLVKTIPGIGWTLGVLSMPAFAAAVTYAIGRVFVMHFESGGTFLTFDPDKARAYFRQELEVKLPAAKSAA